MNIKKIKEELLNNANSKWSEFFSRKSVGIDIADRSIEVVELEKNGKSFRINYARTELPAGIVRQGRIIDESKLSAALRSTLKNAKPNSITTSMAVFGLPESQVYYHVFSVAKQLVADDLARAARQEAETTLPIIFSDQIFSFKAIDSEAKGKDLDKKDILILATSKSLIEEWGSFFKKNKIAVVVLDFEPIASYRALLNEKSKMPVCVVDIGSEQSIFSVLNYNNLFYSYSTQYAGVALTKQVMADVNLGERKIDFDQAESLKIANGLDAASDSGKILRRAFEPIVKEIKVALEVGGGSCSLPLKTIVLTGGSASLLGLSDYLSEVLNGGLEKNSEKYVEVTVGEIKKIGNFKLDIKYSQAVGLALRVLGGGLSEVLDINEKVKNNKKKNSDQVPLKSLDIKLESCEPENQKSIAEMNIEKQKRLLWLILAVGLVLVIGAFWYRSQRLSGKVSTQTTKNQLAIKYSKSSEFEILVSIATSTATTSAVNGVLINDIQRVPASYSDVVKISRNNIAVRLAKDYVLWEEPLKLSSQAKSLIFPLTLTWLELKNDDLARMVALKVASRYPGQVLHGSGLKIKAINMTQTPNLLSALVLVNLSE